MAQDFRIHEDSHVAWCKAVGYGKSLPTANNLAMLAQDEVKAYSTEIAFLEPEIDKLRQSCKGYRVGNFSIYGAWGM